MPKRPQPKTSYADNGDGLSAEEIAEIEGCTSSRIRTILAAAIAKLRKECQRRKIRPEDLFGPLGE